MYQQRICNNVPVRRCNVGNKLKIILCIICYYDSFLLLITILLAD